MEENHEKLMFGGGGHDRKNMLVQGTISSPKEVRTGNIIHSPLAFNTKRHSALPPMNQETSMMNHL